ncbi:hypothetical protein CONPUDRAFT_77034 [Coniophora puteana RWD-64-598 SS2]|uniref:Uncharacterized protein n=1 Tax=Coniophora puteana (strain RWD-64-598) TaxID=741705 RepID=A0A5M3MA62_CONPW|nr:uncharacterized protein CONPUDRAFT_77034 [Coniophora puteana RWD-64-598 SS2]EIW76013.1 hypothetical protein CONPUDRAFT_77034 [Coniophora puteana RWD-64-598 SS2]
MDLAACEVSQHKILKIIKVVLEMADVQAEGSFYCHSVPRIIKEGYVELGMKVVHDIQGADSWTGSGDETTHKHIDYLSEHTYIHTGDQHTLLTLACISPQEKTLLVETLLSKLKGWSTDHVENQKKFFCLLKEWKDQAEWQQRGAAYIQAYSEGDYLSSGNNYTSANIQETAVANAGGPDAWNALEESQCVDLISQLLSNLQSSLETSQFQLFLPDKQKEVDVFIWAGCGITVKQIKLAWTLNSLAASQHALLVSNGGAIKLTVLAGSVFNHHDSKKACHICMLFEAKRPRKLLELSPFHQGVITFLETTIDDPDCVLNPSSSYSTATLDVKLWEQPDVFYAVLAMTPSLLHLQEAFVASI